MAARGRGKAKSNFLAAMGNFSIQYNFTSASIAVQVLSSNFYLGHPLFVQPEWSDDATLAVVFIGAMLGMIFMGRLGDVLGRSRAMRITTSLVMLGAMIPAFAGGSSDTVYGTVCFGRLILGIGVGGIYPLSATHAAEGSSDEASRGLRVGWAFFWQTPGVLVPYLIAMFLFATINPQPPQDWVPQFEFRLLFALGALPALIVFVSTLKEQESTDFQAFHSRSAPRSLLTELRREPLETRKTLLGTAGTWFCYDVAFYGTSVFTPMILNNICMSGDKSAGTCNQTLFQTAWQSVIVTAMGLPGAAVAIALLSRMGSKKLNVYGLILLSINFAVMAILYAVSPASSRSLFILFASLNFLLNFGPNIGTYVLPAVCFPAHIRSTCHGLSAFGGKLGAVVGSLLFPPISSSSLGLPFVLAVQAAVCLIGAFVSQTCLKHDWEYLTLSGRCGTESLTLGTRSLQT